MLGRGLAFERGTVDLLVYNGFASLCWVMADAGFDIEVVGRRAGNMFYVPVFWAWMYEVVL